MAAMLCSIMVIRCKHLRSMPLAMLTMKKLELDWVSIFLYIHVALFP